MDPQAESLLRSVADTASAQFSTPQDRQSLYRLAMHLHRHALHISGVMLSFRLIAYGVPQIDAERVAVAIEQYRELLDLYDRERL